MHCDGSSFPIPEADAGDWIKTPSGCEQIIARIHYEPTVLQRYLSIETESGNVLYIDGSHKLPLNGVVMDAKNVAVGDLVDTVHGPERVQRVDSSVEIGIHNVATYSNYYYVDNIAVTSITSALGMGGIEDFIFEKAMLPYFYVRHMLGIPWTSPGVGPISLPWVCMTLPSGIGILTVFIVEWINLLVVSQRAQCGALFVLAYLFITRAANVKTPTSKKDKNL